MQTRLTPEITEKDLVNGALKAHLGPQFDPVARTWTSKRGTTFKLLSVSLHAAKRIAEDPKTKPQIPTVYVAYGVPPDVKIGEESNPNDPRYLDEMARWQADSQYKMMVYIFGTGIDLKVPPDYVDAQKEFFPNATNTEIKYLYITSLIEADEYLPLMNTITGEKSPTPEGVEAAQAEFRNTGQG